MTLKSYRNDTSEVYASDSYSRPGLAMHDMKVPDAKARYAMDLMRTVGMGMCMDGHPGAKVKTPEEAAAAVCDMADAMFTQLGERGWLIDVPDANTVLEEAREHRGKN